MEALYTEEMPIAEAQQLHAQLELRPDNPALSEPLAVGRRFPAGYRPSYEWSTLTALGTTVDSAENVVGSTQAALTAIVTIPWGGYRSDWGVQTVLALRPGTAFSENNWANLSRFTQPIATAVATLLATTVEALPAYNANWARIQRFPRPLEGEPANRPSYTSLAVVTAEQQAAITGEFPGALWQRTLPDAPGQ